eukprot:761812-Hanusia_phi.AAC.5
MTADGLTAASKGSEAGQQYQHVLAFLLPSFLSERSVHLERILHGILLDSRLLPTPGPASSQTGQDLLDRRGHVESRPPARVAVGRARYILVVDKDRLNLLVALDQLGLDVLQLPPPSLSPLVPCRRDAAVNVVVDVVDVKQDLDMATHPLSCFAASASLLSRVLLLAHRLCFPRHVHPRHRLLSPLRRCSCCRRGTGKRRGDIIIPRSLYFRARITQPLPSCCKRSGSRRRARKRRRWWRCASLHAV